MDQDPKKPASAPAWVREAIGSSDSEPYHIWKPRPLLRSIRWEPSSESAAVSSSPMYETFIVQKALDALFSHVWSTPHETGAFGFLVGDLCECPDSGGRYIIVNAAVPSRFPLKEEDEPQISTEARIALQLEADRHKGVLVGWYHSHPEGSPELSNQDLATHRTMFKEAWHTAILVTTDAARPEGAVFRQTENGMTSQLLPFYEQVSNESLMAKGQKRSRIDWHNFSTDASIISDIAPRPDVPKPARSAENGASLEAMAALEAAQAAEDELARAADEGEAARIAAEEEAARVAAEEEAAQKAAELEAEQAAEDELARAADEEEARAAEEAAKKAAEEEAARIAAEDEEAARIAAEDEEAARIAAEEEAARVAAEEEAARIAAEEEAAQKAAALEAERAAKAEQAALVAKAKEEERAAKAKTKAEAKAEKAARAAKAAEEKRAAREAKKEEKEARAAALKEEKAARAAALQAEKAARAAEIEAERAGKALEEERARAAAALEAEKVAAQVEESPEPPSPRRKVAGGAGAVTVPRRARPAAHPARDRDLKIAAVATETLVTAPSDSPAGRGREVMVGVAGLVIVVAVLGALVTVIRSGSDESLPGAAADPVEVSTPVVAAQVDPVAGSEVEGTVDSEGGVPVTGGAELAPTPISLATFEALGDDMLGVISAFYGQALRHDQGRASCGQLQAAFVSVEDGWISYNVEGKSRYSERLTGDLLERDERLYAGVQDVEREFDRSGCARP